VDLKALADEIGASFCPSVRSAAPEVCVSLTPMMATFGTGAFQLRKVREENSRENYG
jgi:hypothetical protein